MFSPESKRPSGGSDVDATTFFFSPHRARSETLQLRGKILEYTLVGGFVLALAGYEWLRQMVDLPQPLMGITIFAGALAAYCLLRIILLLPRLKALRRGRQAWKSLQMDFEELGRSGFYTFERIRDDGGYELGPVLAGPSGIYNLSVRSNARSGRLFEKIDHVDRDTLQIGGKRAFADPLGQARRAAERVQRFLGSRGLPETAVTPVLVYPGWGIGQLPPGDERDVLVTNEKALASELLERSRRLEPKDLIPVCEALEAARA